jgi:hypothetical protein
MYVYIYIYIHTHRLAEEEEETFILQRSLHLSTVITAPTGRERR